MDRKTINLVISVDENYKEHAKDLILSLAENNNNIFFHIWLIYNNKLSKDSLNELKDYCDSNDYGLIDEIYFDGDESIFPMKVEYITPVTYFRLFAPYLLPDNIDRFLYLDCDIICNGSIEELYNINLDDKIIAACKNISKDTKWLESAIEGLHLEDKDKYINAGVLLIDNRKYKEFISIDDIYKFIEKNYDVLKFQDQDVINVMFYNKIKYIDNMYNYQVNGVQGDISIIGPKLIHYSEKEKPWIESCTDFMRAIHYYLFLYNHGRENELKELLYKKYGNNDFMKYVKVFNVKK